MLGDNKTGLEVLQGSQLLVFFNFGNLSFRQIAGIPISSHPVSSMENLFLKYYENRWLLDTKKSDLCKARHFSNTFRFIDEFIIDGLEFDRDFKNIYSSELQTQLYDNRDAFPFVLLDYVYLPYLLIFFLQLQFGTWICHIIPFVMNLVFSTWIFLLRFLFFFFDLSTQICLGSKCLLNNV